MCDVNVFVASSFDTRAWREAIGNGIREWNDALEPKGYRLRMKCWEDYNPEYNGIRKQDEYNENLIRQSHLLIALFENNCGDYTKEEIKLGLKLYPENVHVLRHDISPKNIAIDEFLDSVILKPVLCEDITGALAHVKSIIDKYINNLTGSAANVPKRVFNIYATIPDDRKEERIPLGNMIRFMDDTAESKFNVRCKLFHDKNAEIHSSHYYLSILKDVLTITELNELCVALNNTSASGNPMSSVIYINDFANDTAIEKNPALEGLINRKGIFKEPFDNRHRVKFNLLMWLLNKSLLMIDRYSALSIKDDWIEFYGIKIIKWSDLKLEGNTPEEKIAALITYANKSLIFKTNVADEATHLTDAEIKNIISECGISEKVRKGLEAEEKEKLNKAKDTINSKLKELLEAKELSEADQKQIANYYKDRITIEQSLCRLGAISAKEILRAQFALLAFMQEYPQTFKNQDEDICYKWIAETADEYQVIDPQVEMYRMNYANSLIRGNDNRPAVELYNLSMDRFEGFDDTAELIRTYIVHLFINGINFFTHLGLIEDAKVRIKELENKFKKWAEYSSDNSNLFFYHVMVLAAKLRIRPFAYNMQALIDNAIEILPQLKDQSTRLTDTTIEDDIFCDFRICLAATMIDYCKDNRLSLLQHANTIERILNDAYSWLDNNPDLSIKYKLQEKGEVYHNLSFLYANLGKVDKERRFAKLTIAQRREAYQKFGNTEIKKAIADGLINLGASYVKGSYKILPKIEKAIGLRCAEESLEIYNALNTSNYLNQVTDVYKALLLKGTILFRSADKTERKTGYTLIEQCLTWSNNHPDNYYFGTFTWEFANALANKGRL